MLAAGVHVRVVGLLSRPELNGRPGLVCKADAKRPKRWNVQVEGEQRKLSLKEENLQAEVVTEGDCGSGGIERAQSEPQATATSKTTWRHLIEASVEVLRDRFRERSRTLGCTLLPVVPRLNVTSGELTGNKLYRNEWGWSILTALVRACRDAATSTQWTKPADVTFVCSVLLPVLAGVAGTEDADGFARLDVDAAVARAISRVADPPAVPQKRKRFAIETATSEASHRDPDMPARGLPAAAASTSTTTNATHDSGGARPNVRPSDGQCAQCAHAAPPDSPAAVRLRDEGWCVLPLFPADEVGHVREAFWQAVASFPEYAPAVRTAELAADVTQHYVQGGFGALGNPASFHNRFARDWRARALTAVVEQRVFSAVMAAHPAGATNVRLEQLIDRMLVRRPSKRATAESWHRDEAVGCLDDDVVFGGWINFDPHPQVLLSRPGPGPGPVLIRTPFTLLDLTLLGLIRAPHPSVG